MLNYSGLASAVILRAHDDLFGASVQVGTGNSTKAMRRRERWREDSKEFLGGPNEDLKFWCVIGGLNMGAIIEQTKRKLEEAKGETV